MKVRNLLLWLTGGFLAGMLVLLAAACGDVLTTSLLATVPSNSSAVLRIDFDRVLKQSGCQMDVDGRIQLSPEFNQLMLKANSGEASPLVYLLDMGDAVNIKEVVGFLSEDSSDMLYTFHVNDLEKAVAAISGKALAQPLVSDGFSLYDIGGRTVALFGNQGWLLPYNPDKALLQVKRFEHLKNDESMAGVPAVKQTIDDADGAIRLAAGASLLRMLDTGVQDSWACFNIKLEESVIGIRFNVMASDGVVLPLSSSLNEIDGYFLRYVPRHFVMAAAAGCTSSTDWKRLLGPASLIFGYDTAKYEALLRPVLDEADGTVAVAVGPAGTAPAIADVNWRTWNFIAMAHLPPRKINAIVKQFKKFAEQSEAAVEVSEMENVYKCHVADDTDIYFGNVDGYLMLANILPSPTGQNSMAEIFLSKRAGLVLNIPAGSEVVKAFGWPWGIDFNLEIQEKDAYASLSLNGSNISVLRAFVNYYATK